MAMVRPFVFQVVGYQNSGKTTLSEALIKRLNEKGITVAAIKHHGHGGKPNIEKEKDSTRHASAGALAALVEGGGRLVLQSEKDNWTLDEQIAIMSAFDPDAILVEGHKHAAYPKIVLIRNSEDEQLLFNLENILAASYWKREPSIKGNYPTYAIQQSQTPDYLANLIAKTMGLPGAR
ncbi:molybdopterin-guanine dinucleotide biosynthesis protein B [Bacillus sp. FJAT-27445]|uniref:molybdopterin-guanine dinucleotide biosynthesis protein B n=1 Tax=Bacillus sp. FJAT-27445 TaxID=1679166 RepID=UPI000743B910|nr:molybdopterin-guanine dinucleotide biosynthesis protein B [Bacillus sp. FJAT-27445]